MTTQQLIINAYLAGASAALRNRNGTFLEYARAYAAEHAPKPKAKRKKAASSDAMSPGAAAWAEACRNAKTSAALEPEKLQARAMSICDRKEGKPGPAPGWSRYRLRYSENPKYQAVIAGKVAELAKLGVLNVEMQSREEYEAEQRDEQLRSVLHHLPNASSFNGARSPDRYQESIRHARIFARELWQHDRGQALFLTEKIRKAECIVRMKFPDYKRLHGPWRER